MCGPPPPCHYILGSVSTFKHNDISVFKHLCVGPLHHTTISLVQFQHSSVMTFLHLTFYAWVPSITPLHPWFSLKFKCADIFAFKHLCMCPPHHTTICLVQLQHSSMMTFFHSNLCMHHITISLVQFQHSSMMTFLH